MTQILKRVVKGTYADFRVVKTRKVLQMVIELPIEQADDFTKKFGMPNPSIEKWVAVAYLNDEEKNVPDEYTKIVQMAGILCKTPKFGEFINHRFKSEININDGEAIASALRSVCGIASRSDLSTNEIARKSFLDLHTEYRKWLEEIPK